MTNFNRLYKLLAVVVSLIIVANTSVQINAYSDHYSGMAAQSLLLDSERLYQWHTFWKPINTVDSYRESKTAVDSMGNIFIVTSSDSAWSGPTNPGCGSSHPYTRDFDILIVKLSPQGDYQCHTFLGGTGSDFGMDIAIDPYDNVYVGGYGMDWNFSEISPRQSHDPGGPTFTVTRLDNNLGYQWHTFVGKFVNTFGGIALDPDNNIYVNGASRESNYGTDKLTIAKIRNSVTPAETDGTEIWFRSYGEDAHGYDIAVDDEGVVAVGYSYSIWPIGSNSPLQGIAFQSIPIIKLDLDGNYQWHTFYGLHNESARAVKIDNQGNIMIAGHSNGFPVNYGEDPIHDSSGYTNAYVLKLNSSGSYVWHTFYGDSDLTVSGDLFIDQQGYIYLTGRSNGSMLGEFSTGPIHPFAGHTNIFILSLWPNGHYRWHTFYGTGIGENGIYDDGFGISGHDNKIVITGVSENEWYGDNNEPPLNNFGIDHGLFVLALKSSAIIPISGRVIWDNGTPEQGVKVTAMRIGISPSPDEEVPSSITDDQGRYHLVVQGLFDFIKPVKDGLTFFPGRENIGVCLSCISGNFEIPKPFLHPPVFYTDFSQALLGNTIGVSRDGGKPGRVNSWFDHNLPNYGKDYEITTWLSPSISYPPGPANNPNINCTLGLNCYAGHNGIDFQHDRSIVNEPIYSAYSGTVIDTPINPLKDDCPKSPSLCPNNWLGNQVWINHGNGYATVYGHLDIVKVKKGDNVVSHQEIGIMGNSGNSSGIHLHFALYFDIDNDSLWEIGEEVDPYGWVSFESDHKLDPWELVVVDNVIKPTGHPASRWMWKDPPQTPISIGASGGTINSVSGITQVTVPSGAVSSNHYFELWDTSPILDPLPSYRSTGRASWLRIPSLEPSNNISYDQSQNTSNGFNQPLSIEVRYEGSDLLHLDENSLTLVQYDETAKRWSKLNSNIDKNTNKVYAQTYDAGRFDLQAQLRCSKDVNEPDDGYSGSKLIELSNNSNMNFFDSPSDEDWFRFNANTGVTYTIDVLPTTPEVKPVIELYAVDGETLLETSTSVEGKEVLEWKAESQGIYYVRVRQAAGSAYGCDAGIQANLAAKVSTWLPMLRR